MLAFRMLWIWGLLGALLPVLHARAADLDARDLGDDWSQGTVEQVIGFYSEGRLVHPDRMPVSGSGFVKLFQGSDHGYGTFDLITVIRRVADALHEDYPAGERLQVGDLSARRGGQLRGHASHQVGLDADIVYFRVNHREMPTHTEKDDFDEQFVTNGKLSRNFDTVRNWSVIRRFVSTGRVNRIFVDARIKLNFCAYARHIGMIDSPEGIETLRRLRPWPNHRDHFHLRLTCPDRSPRCRTQDEPEPGTGCERALSLQAMEEVEP